MFFLQAEGGIRDDLVTGVQTCALPISPLTASTRTSWYWPSGKVVCASPDASLFNCAFCLLSDHTRTSASGMGAPVRRLAVKARTWPGAHLVTTPRAVTMAMV